MCLNRCTGSWSSRCGPASPAEDAGLQPGDVIIEVNRKPASRPAISSTRCTRARPAGTCSCSYGRRATPAIALCTRIRRSRTANPIAMGTNGEGFPASRRFLPGRVRAQFPRGFPSRMFAHVSHATALTNPQSHRPICGGLPHDTSWQEVQWEGAITCCMARAHRGAGRVPRSCS